MSAVAQAAPASFELSLPDLDLVRDFYLADKDGGASESFCFLGKAKRVWIRGTQLEDWTGDLLRHVRATHPTELDFQVTSPTGETFRGHRIRARRGPMLSLRRLPERSPSLLELSMQACWRDLLLSPNLLQGGLILMAAETGQGKSTTVAAIIRSRLEMYGGFALTIEDPIELPLDGAHGDGECLQTAIDPSKSPELGYAEAMRGAFRSFPALAKGGSILLIGEIRDPDIAADAIRAAVAGQLVISTIHASDITTSLSRLCAMAALRMGDENARDMLASALRIGIHQTLTLKEAGAGWSRGIIGGELVWSGANHSAIANAIRGGNFTSINQSISQQTALMNRPVRPSLPELMKNLG